MKKVKSVLLICMIGLLLSACSVKQDAANLYKKETPLEAAMEIPQSIKTNDITTIKVLLTQNGEKVVNADYVHFEIWKQDGSIQRNMEAAIEEGNGVYSIQKRIESNGLYFVRVHASNENSIIMPQQQFIVGNLTDSELEYLQKDIIIQEESHQHHH